MNRVSKLELPKHLIAMLYGLGMVAESRRSVWYVLRASDEDYAAQYYRCYKRDGQRYYGQRRDSGREEVVIDNSARIVEFSRTEWDPESVARTRTDPRMFPVGTFEFIRYCEQLSRDVSKGLGWYLTLRKYVGRFEDDEARGRMRRVYEMFQVVDAQIATILPRYLSSGVINGDAMVWSGDSTSLGLDEGRMHTVEVAWLRCVEAIRKNSVSLVEEDRLLSLFELFYLDRTPDTRESFNARTVGLFIDRNRDNLTRNYEW